MKFKVLKKKKERKIDEKKYSFNNKCQPQLHNIILLFGNLLRNLQAKVYLSLNIFFNTLAANQELSRLSVTPSACSFVHDIF